jgi:hypothetical protein
MSLLRRPWQRLTRTGEGLARAIYGTVLTMAIVAGLSADRHVGLGLAALTLLAEATVFWLAHVYADLVGRHLEHPRAARSRAVALDVARTQLPLLEAAVIPALMLVLGWIGIFTESGAYWLALAVGAVELTLWGVLYARAVGYGRRGLVIAAAVNLALGLAVVGLKVVVS